MPTTVVPYLRFSPRREGELSESLETQLAYIVQHCALKDYMILCRDGVIRKPEDVQVAMVWADAEWSGDDEARPSIWQAIMALPKKAILLAYKYDRLARDFYLEETIRRKVLSKKCQLEVVVDCYEGEDPQKVAMREMMAVFNKLDKKVKAAQTRASMRMLQKTGRMMGSRPMYGWRRTADAVVVGRDGSSRKRRHAVRDEREQANIVRLMELYHETPDYTVVTNTLNAAGIPCRSGKWQYTLVRKIVERELGLDA